MKTPSLTSTQYVVNGSPPNLGANKYIPEGFFLLTY